MKSKKYKLSAIVFYSVIIALALVLPNMAFAGTLPDTGQTKCYSNSAEIPCPQPGEPFYGQDAQYSTNPHSYTDLGNGVVKDNVTNLMWQQATALGNYAWQQAIDYCNNLSLGGYDDWRLPTIKELSTLVDSSIPYPGPTIKTSYFPDTVASYYWSSTTYAYSNLEAWAVSFGFGYVSHGLETGSHYVRAVRGGQTSNNFIDNGNGTITDTSTGLMWQQVTAPGIYSCSEELTPVCGYRPYNWEEALTYCENLTLADKSDWRLPNRNELQSIVDYSKYNPAINTTYFPDTVASYYWSSTTPTNSSSYTWYVNFGHGYVNNLGYGYKSGDHLYVRAVRGGQGEPTVINLSSFTATPKSGKVILNGLTESETDNAGFNLYRSATEDGEYAKINTSLIPSQGSSTQGAFYEFTDNNVQNRKTYYYKLEDIDLSGNSTMHGPVSATPRWFYWIGK